MEDKADPQVRRIEELAKIGTARLPQDARLRPLPRGCRNGWHPAFHRLVRTRSPHRFAPKRRSFMRRFANMRWSIPDAARALSTGMAKRCNEGPPAKCRKMHPAVTPVEDLWRSYYASYLPIRRA